MIFFAVAALFGRQGGMAIAKRCSLLSCISRNLAEKTSRKKSGSLSCTGFRDSLLITNSAKYILQTELLDENVTLQLSGAREKNESTSGLIFSEFDTPPTLTWHARVY